MSIVQLTVKSIDHDLQLEVRSMSDMKLIQAKYRSTTVTSIIRVNIRITFDGD